MSDEEEFVDDFSIGGDSLSEHNGSLQDGIEEDDTIFRTVNLIRPPGARPWYWIYFGQYPSTVARKGEFVVCRICHEKYKDNMTVSPKTWEVCYGKSKSFVLMYMN
jgi:hypothetical protein